MAHPSRRLLQALVVLVLLWQTVTVAAAAMGCCTGQQACCAVVGAPAVCSACAPVLLPLASGLQTGLAAPGQRWPASQPTGHFESHPAAIWRPPDQPTARNT